MVEVSGPFDVTVLRLQDCQPILRFTGRPGRIHAIQFVADGTATMAIAPGSDGGGLGPSPPRCALPDTGSAPAATPGSDPAPVALVLALAAAMGALLGWSAGREQTRER